MWKYSPGESLKQYPNDIIIVAGALKLFSVTIKIERLS